MRNKIYLTPREYEVLTLLSHGFTVEQAAKHLHISPKTVETHGIHIRDKTLNPRGNWGYFKTMFISHPSQFDITNLKIKRCKEQRIIIYQMYKDGVSKADISRKLGIHVKTVHDVFRFLRKARLV